VRRLVLDVKRASRRDLPDPAAADEFHHLLADRRRPPLRADLRHALMMPRRVHHRPAFRDRQRQRLLDVNVLPRLAGVDHLKRVPMVGCVDDDRIDVLAIEQPAVVGVSFDAAARLFDREVEVRRYRSQMATTCASSCARNASSTRSPRLPTPIKPSRMRFAAEVLVLVAAAGFD
jgi:hypothetical protein